MGHELWSVVERLPSSTQPAASTVPIITLHLQMAEQMQATVGGR